MLLIQSLACYNEINQLKGRERGATVKALVEQFLKFGIVGVLATLIDYLALYLFSELVGVYYLWAKVLAFVVATVFNYWASMRYVFQAKSELKDERAQSFVLFLITCLAGLALSLLIMWLVVDVLGIKRVLLANLIATPFVMVFNFVTRKLLLEGSASQRGKRGKSCE